MTDYEILRQAAESGKREDIDALGRWFEREGRDYWNGEYYDADGIELYPLYKVRDAHAGDYDIVGYTTDRAASVDSLMDQEKVNKMPEDRADNVGCDIAPEAQEIIDNGNFDAAVALMDDEIREAVHADLAPCSEAEFLTEYMARHIAKYGEPFRV